MIISLVEAFAIFLYGLHWFWHCHFITKKKRKYLGFITLGCEDCLDAVLISLFCALHRLRFCYIMLGILHKSRRCWIISMSNCFAQVFNRSHNGIVCKTTLFSNSGHRHAYWILVWIIIFVWSFYEYWKKKHEFNKCINTYVSKMVIWGVNKIE